MPRLAVTHRLITSLTTSDMAAALGLEFRGKCYACGLSFRATAFPLLKREILDSYDCEEASFDNILCSQFCSERNG